MEIDFLGLNSTTANRPNNNIDEVENYGFKQASSTTLTEANLGVVETSLSLSTGHSLYYHREILNFSEKKKGKLAEFSSSSSGGSTATRCSFTGKQSLAFVPPPIYRPSASTTAAPGPFYNLKLRKIHEIQAKPASIITMLYDNAQEKAVPGLSVHARICSTGPGYSTPTVAMARRATLARFLEKRLHRMNQARKAHLMGKSIYNATNNTYEACDHHHRSVVTRKNNNNNNNIVKR